MLLEGYTEKTGHPFEGEEKERLIAFLQEQELEYDENITYSYVMEDEGEIIATGSCHKNVLKCIAVSPNYQGKNLLAVVMTHLVEQMFHQGNTHYFGFTKPKNKAVFCNMGMHPIAETKDVLLLENKKNGLRNYLNLLQNETLQQKEAGTENELGSGVGAIVANCNPFTKGHRYLIEQAADKCKWLHLFILSEEQSDFTSKERFDMVKEGVEDISNVILHRTSDYLISPAVFPTYFIKDKANAYTINCMLDIEIFKNHIAKKFEITKRFIGSEPDCKVTGQYNECLKNVLPECGIEVYEIPRCKIKGNVISASKVRQAWKAGELEQVEYMIPETTKKHLLKGATELREVTLYEMLDARESRVERQQKYLSEYHESLISFMLNIPGPLKVSDKYFRVFEDGISRIRKKLREKKVNVTEESSRYLVTGYEYYAVVPYDSKELKFWMTEIEEENEQGRLYDIDVLEENGKKISRTEIGAAPRKCLLCEKEAHLCARSRAHHMEEILAKVEEIVESSDTNES